MITGKQIPDGVIDAAEKAFYERTSPRMSMRDAIVAALNAWPEQKATCYFARGKSVVGIVLPVEDDEEKP